MELLESAVNFCPPSTGSGSSQSSVEEILSTLHGARDKHIFRILATITHPNHSMQARARAFEELPKRTKSLGKFVSGWIRDLVRRCAMSNFLNDEIVKQCALLANECFKENDVPSTAALLTCVKLAIEIFPSLGATEETFSTLTDLFANCRKEPTPRIKQELERYNIVSALSSILSMSSSAKPTVVVSAKKL